MLPEHLGAAAIFYILRRHLDIHVSHIVDYSILGGGYWVIFMVLTIGISLFTASLSTCCAEGEGFVLWRQRSVSINPGFRLWDLNMLL